MLLALHLTNMRVRVCACLPLIKWSYCPHRWALDSIGSSSSGCSEEFRGQAAFSEPETQVSPAPLPAAVGGRRLALGQNTTAPQEGHSFEFDTAVAIDT